MKRYARRACLLHFYERFFFIPSSLCIIFLCHLHVLFLLLHPIPSTISDLHLDRSPLIQERFGPPSLVVLNLLTRLCSLIRVYDPSRSAYTSHFFPLLNFSTLDSRSLMRFHCPRSAHSLFPPPLLVDLSLWAARATPTDHKLSTTDLAFKLPLYKRLSHFLLSLPVVVS